MLSDFNELKLSVTPASFSGGTYIVTNLENFAVENFFF